MSLLFLDTETYCETPLKRGVHRYAESVEVMMLQWAVDDGEVVVEDLTDGAPTSAAFMSALDAAERVVMHNSGFDRTVLRHALGIDIPAERIDDTMVIAMQHSLPGSLGKLCEILRVASDAAKDKDGSRLIRLFCMPLPRTMKLRRATKATHPEDWAKFCAYGGSDILAMREIYRKLPRWNWGDDERALWVLDQRINDRGVTVDVALAEHVLQAVEVEQKRLSARVREETLDEVTSATQRDALLKFILEAYGVDLPDLKKSTLERRLGDPELPESVKLLLGIRLAAATSSTAKYKALLNSVSSDGKLRGTLQFAGALRTGRWSGRLFQPQNMPRPDMPHAAIELAIRCFFADCADIVFDDEVMRAAANVIRGVIIASPGRRLVVSDLSNIEGRTAAWLAGEDWKLEAFRAYDAGMGPDLYIAAYARAFNIPPDQVTKAQRPIGKVMELALGYEGGVAAFLTFAAVYRLDLDALADAAYPVLPEKVKAQAEIILQWRRKKGLSTFGLSDRVFVVCEALKSMWRAAHPNISGYWPKLNEAAIEAVQTPGKTVRVGRLAFRRKGAWLRMILPSGRSLCYPGPKLVKGGLRYAGVNQYTRQWVENISTYGGKLFENACQAVARDVMAHNMPAIEAAGFSILLSVHDELITEALDNDRMIASYLSELLSTCPPWMAGCPLAASGFHDYRYRKDD